jgi:glucose/arabinose dehydrogenase
MGRGRATLAVLAVVLIAGCSASAQPRATLSPTRPSSLAIGPKGQLYVADDARNQILQALPGGKFRVIAGTGRAGFTGDGGPAAKAELDDPGGMAIAPDGTIYLADTGNNRIRAIAPDGTIETVAGGGQTPGWVAGGTKAAGATLDDPADVTLSAKDILYISDADEILSLAPGGRFDVVAGKPGARGAPKRGARATRTSADDPSGIAFDRSGDLFVFGTGTKTLYMISRSGRVTLPIGRAGFYPRGTAGLVTAPSGHVLAMDTQQIVEVTRNGIRALDTLPVNLLPAGIAVAASGTIYIDTWLGDGWSTQTALAELTASGPPTIIWKSSIS